MTRLTDKHVPSRTYYVFFTFTSKYSGCFYCLNAESIDRARMKAWDLFGFENVGTIENDEETAKAKIQAFKFKSLVNKEC